MAFPTIDVATVCRDPGPPLENTILSVLNEPTVTRHIVIDGASRDGTKDLLHKYERKLATIISEADHGIAHAMNKALTYCKADYVIFLHAGDVFLKNGALEAIRDFLTLEPVDIVSCPVLLGTGERDEILNPRGLNVWMRFKTGIPHQGAVLSRQLFDRIGQFDTHLKVAMDYDFFLRAYLAGATVRHCSVPLSRMAPGGLSWRRDWPSLKARLAEEKLIHARYADSRALRLLYAGYWGVYPAYKYLRTCLP